MSPILPSNKASLRDNWFPRPRFKVTFYHVTRHAGKLAYADPGPRIHVREDERSFRGIRRGKMKTILTELRETFHFSVIVMFWFGVWRLC